MLFLTLKNFFSFFFMYFKVSVLLAKVPLNTRLSEFCQSECWLKAYINTEPKNCDIFYKENSDLKISFLSLNVDIM